MQAAPAQCDTYLAIIHIGESGAAEPEDDYFYRSRGNRYQHYDDGEKEDDDQDVSFTVATVDDSGGKWTDGGTR